MSPAILPSSRSVREAITAVEYEVCEATAEHFDDRSPIGHLDELIDTLKEDGVIEHLPRRTIQRLEAISDRLHQLDKQLFARCDSLKSLEFFHRLADELDRMEAP